MTRYALVTLFAVLVAVAYAVNANERDAQPNPPQDEVTVTVTAPMSASQPIPVVVGVKGRFSVTLAANHTTGYSWRLAKPLDATILKNTSSIYNEPKSDLVGAPGTEVWTFEPVGKGATTMVMEYVRPWEKDAKPAKTQTFQVTVK